MRAHLTTGAVMKLSFWATAALLPLSLLAACASKGSNGAEERLCTPGAYVYCRCADKTEGTKLCKSDGKSFEGCQPCDEHGGEDPTGGDDPSGGGTDPAGGGGKLPEDAGFTA